MFPISPSADTPAIGGAGIRKSYAGVHALSGVSISLHSGEIHGIAGENGSGKSTLLACLAGAIQPDDGELLVDGVHRGGWRSIREASASGVALVSQELTLVPQMSIAANIALASGRIGPGWLLTERSTLRAVGPILDRVGLGDIDPRVPVDELPLHIQQLVEIGRALSARPRVLLLDEPTSSLERSEASVVLDLARDLAGDGMAVALITHRMRELMTYADRITVLRDGHCITQDAPRGQWSTESITRDMVGRDIDVTARAGEAPNSQVLLEVRDLSEANGRCSGIDVSVRAGEIVGLAGLVGAGRTEFLETVFGVRKRAGGTVSVDGAQVAPSIRGAMRGGLRLVPDDRLGKALIPEMTVAENLDLDWRPRLAMRPLRRLVKNAESLKQDYRIAGGSAIARVRSLSGGNQQKVVFARQLKSAPRVLLLDEPTRGVDVGAKAELYDLLRAEAGRGAAIVVASSELEELMQLCHRILVMFEGRVVADFVAAAFDDEAITAAATGQAS